MFHIGELSKQTGLSKTTLRYYERCGLLPKPDRSNPYNNYRTYSQATKQRLQQIVALKTLGFTLHNIKQLLQLPLTGEAACREQMPAVASKIAALEQQIARLKLQKKNLQLLVSKCPKRCGLQELLA